MSMPYPRPRHRRWPCGLIAILIVAGSDVAGFAGDDDAAALRTERVATKRVQNQRLAREQAERERRDLVAFSHGTVDERVRLCVRKHLRRLEGDTAGASLLSEPIGDLPPADFRRLDGVLAFLAEDGSLPPPPALTPGTRQARFWNHVETNWSACLERLQQRQYPGAPLVEEFQASVRRFRDSVPTPADRSERLALEADLRNLEQLSRQLKDLRAADRMGRQLTGFPGGTVNNLVHWVLGLNLSARPGTVGHQHLRRVGVALVSACDRSQGRGRLEPGESDGPLPEPADVPPEASPFDNDETNRPAAVERPPVPTGLPAANVGPLVSNPVIRAVFPAVPATDGIVPTPTFPR